MWVHLISPVTEEEYCIDLAQADTVTLRQRKSKKGEEWVVLINGIGMYEHTVQVFTDEADARKFATNLVEVIYTAKNEKCSEINKFFKPTFINVEDIWKWND
jgi:hypothetical protein